MSSKKKRNPKPLVPKKNPYRTLWIALGVIFGFVAIVVAFVFGAAGTPKGGETPAALTAAGGILVTQANVSDNPASVPIGPVAQGSTSDPAEIIIVQDYNCVHCGAFEEANHDFIDGLLKDGASTVEYRPVAIQGDYSSRTANAAICLTETAPNVFYDWNGAMFEKQNGAGLTDEEIVAVAEGVGVDSPAFGDCVEDEKHRRWVAQQSVDVFANPLVGSSPEVTITGTPGVFVNGQWFQNQPEVFAEFFQSVVAGATSEDGTEVTVPATPVETESPAGE